MDIPNPFFASPSGKNSKEADQILSRYPDKIPVILDRITKSIQIPELDKRKYLVPCDQTMGQFLYFIRKRMQLSPDKALFMFVRNCIVCNTDSIAKVYAEYHDTEDRFLYITYGSENTFGCGEGVRTASSICYQPRDCAVRLFDPPAFFTITSCFVKTKRS